MPFPFLQQQRETVACYNAVHPGASYWQDCLAAYAAVGLLREAGGEAGDRCALCSLRSRCVSGQANQSTVACALACPCWPMQVRS